jgi:hypothetical protein
MTACTAAVKTVVVTILQTIQFPHQIKESSSTATSSHARMAEIHMNLIITQMILSVKITAYNRLKIIGNNNSLLNHR